MFGCNTKYVLWLGSWAGWGAQAWALGRVTRRRAAGRRTRAAGGRTRGARGRGVRHERQARGRARGDMAMHGLGVAWALGGCAGWVNWAKLVHCAPGSVLTRFLDPVRLGIFPSH